MLRWTIVLASCVMAMASRSFAQESGWHSLQVPGGRATLRALGVSDDRARAAVMIEIVRRLHFSTQKQDALESAIRRIPLTGAETITLPLPMASSTWEKAIFQKTVPPSRLFSEILNDRAARLLYHGLAGLDESTRTWIEQQPALLRALYRDQDAVQSFALFAPALHIESAAVVVTGGDVAAQKWSSVLGAPLTDPQRFVSRLFLEREGRVAGLYFLSGFVDAPRRQFLLGGNAKDSARLSALASSFAACYPRQSNDYPFVLRSKDPAWLLLNVAVTSDGQFAGPRTQAFWHDVFEPNDLHTQTVTTDGGSVDAAWIVERLCRAGTTERSSVFETLLAGQRLFANAPQAEIDASRALRVRRQFPAVFVALERAGFRNAGTYVAVGRAAQMLDRLNDLESTPAVLQQFQGALDLVLGMAAAHTLPEQRARNLILALADIRLYHDRYDGHIALWLDQQLVPPLRAALNAPQTMTLEELMARALAGPAPVSPRRVEWESLEYIVDYSAATRERLLAVRAKQGGSTLDRALDECRNAHDAAAIRAADATLGQVLASWAYAPHIGAADSGALLGGDVSLRHDLGLRQVNRTRFEQRWEVAIAPLDRGQIAGSYLAMDAALANWSLRRLAVDRIPAPPTLGDNDRISLVGAIAFSDPTRLTDEDMRSIASALATGTRAVHTALEDRSTLAELADRAAISPWIRAVLPWMIEAEPDRVEAQFSLTHRARLGGLDDQSLPQWGTSMVPVGCQCLRAAMPYIPELVIGRPVDGIVGAYSADLTFRIAELLTELNLPAQLTTAVLAYALRDYIDGVQPAHPADVDAFARQAPKLTRIAVEDYVGAIAAVGALRLVTKQ